MNEVEFLKIPEILAPAGDFECLIAAISAGADAVYLAGNRFGARASATNFNNEELKKAVEYAHLYGTKIYVTVNTIMFDNEMKMLNKFLNDIYLIGVDGILVQELFIAQFVRENYKELPVHISTQMTIVNSDSINVLSSLGVKRIVLGRELSIDEIKEIREKTDIELEVFVHGALCVSYSGKCLMSSMIGGRSGNRGRCAQPCRQKYILKNAVTGELKSNKEYLLSTKDIATIEILPDIVRAGVDSLKIEGRMKRPEYVYNVVKIYRKYLDIIKNGSTNLSIDKKDLDTLLVTYNRGGFSKGYLTKTSSYNRATLQRGKNWGIKIGEVVEVISSKSKIMILLEKEVSRLDSIEFWVKNENGAGKIIDVMYDLKGNKIENAKSGDRIIVSVNDIGDIEEGTAVYKILSKKLSDQLKKVDVNSERKVDISITFKAQLAKNAYLKIVDNEGNEVQTYSDNKVEKAMNVNLTEEKLLANLTKLGGTPFNIVKSDIALDTNINIPASVINKMRREAVEHLISIRQTGNKYGSVDFNVENTFLSEYKHKQVVNKKHILVDVYNIEQLNIALAKEIDYVVYEIEAYTKDSLKYDITKIVNEKNKKLIIKIPYIFKQDKLDNLYIWMDKLKSQLHEGKNICGIMCNDLAVLNYITQNNFALMKLCDYGFNISNTPSSEAYKKLGFNGGTMSVEMRLDQIKSFNNNKADDFFAVFYAHGYIQNMISEYCIISSSLKIDTTCESCKKMCYRDNFVIEDKMEKRFRIDTNSLGQTILFNSDLLYNADRMLEFCDNGIQNIRIDLNFHDEQLSSDVLNYYVDAFKYGKPINSVSYGFKYTRGHFYRGIE